MADKSRIPELEALEAVQLAVELGLAGTVDVLDASFQRRLVDAMLGDSTSVPQLAEAIGIAWDRATACGLGQHGARFDAYLGLLERLRDRLADRGTRPALSPSTVRAHVLALVVDEGPQRIGVLADRLGKEASAISREVNKLEESGYVHKQRIGREAYVHAREAGRDERRRLAELGAGPGADGPVARREAATVWSLDNVGLTQPEA